MDTEPIASFRRAVAVAALALTLSTGALAQQMETVAPVQPRFDSSLINSPGPSNTTDRPDPTVLTTQAQEKAILALKELLLSEIQTLKNDIIKLQDSIDTRPAVLKEGIDQLQALLSQKVGDLQALMDEKFKGVANEFAGRDVALAAALLAQETSVQKQNSNADAAQAKSEASITKQIDAISDKINGQSTSIDDKIDAVRAQITQQTKASDDKIADLSSRLTTIEGKSSGSTDTISYIFGLVGGAGVLFGIFMAVLHLNTTNRRQPVVINGTNGVPYPT